MYTTGQEQRAGGSGSTIAIVIAIQAGINLFGNMLRVWLPRPEAYGVGLLLMLLLCFPWRPAEYRAWPFWRWALWSLGWASLVAFVMQCLAFIVGP